MTGPCTPRTDTATGCSGAAGAASGTPRTTNRTGTKARPPQGARPAVASTGGSRQRAGSQPWMPPISPVATKHRSPATAGQPDACAVSPRSAPVATRPAIRSAGRRAAGAASAARPRSARGPAGQAPTPRPDDHRMRQGRDQDSCAKRAARRHRVDPQGGGRNPRLPRQGAGRGRADRLHGRHGRAVAALRPGAVPSAGGSLPTLR